MAALFPGTQPLSIYNIVDGINTVKSGVRIGPTELKDAQNVRYRPVGGFRWRQGYVTLGNAPGTACTGLFMARFSSNTNVAFRTRGASLEKMDALDGTWDDITGSLSLTAGQDNVFNFAILNDIVIAVNGVDVPAQISSALSASTVSGAHIATASHVFTHRGYMFYITMDRAYFSTIYDPVTVGVNNYLQPGSKQGGNLVGGVDYNGKAYLFRRHGIYAAEFQPTATDSTGTLFPFVTIPNPIVPNVGTQSARSIVKFTTPSTHKAPGYELVFFVDQFGVPRLFDGSTSRAIGASILDSRDGTITSLANTNTSRLQYVWAVNDAANNLVYLFMSSSGASKHDICWILDYNTTFAWARDSYHDTFNCGAIFENASGYFKLYFGNYGGQVFESGSGQTDNGFAIPSYVRTGDLFVGDPSTLTKWLYNEVRGTAGSDTQSIDIAYYQDGEDNPSITSSMILFRANQAQWDVATWDQFNWVYSGLTTKSSEIGLEAKTLGVKFSNSTRGNTHSIEGFSLYALPEGWKQEQ